MSPEKQTLWIIRGTIAEMPEKDRSTVKSAEEEIRAVLAKYPAHAPMAVALIGAELATAD